MTDNGIVITDEELLQIAKNDSGYLRKIADMIEQKREEEQKKIE